MPAPRPALHVYLSPKEGDDVVDDEFETPRSFVRAPPLTTSPKVVAITELSPTMHKVVPTAVIRSPGTAQGAKPVVQLVRQVSIPVRQQSQKTGSSSPSALSPYCLPSNTACVSPKAATNVTVVVVKSQNEGLVAKTDLAQSFSCGTPSMTPSVPMPKPSLGPKCITRDVQDKMESSQNTTDAYSAVGHQPSNQESLLSSVSVCTAPAGLNRHSSRRKLQEARCSILATDPFLDGFSSGTSDKGFCKTLRTTSKSPSSPRSPSSPSGRFGRSPAFGSSTMSSPLVHSRRHDESGLGSPASTAFSLQSSPSMVLSLATERLARHDTRSSLSRRALTQSESAVRRRRRSPKATEVFDIYGSPQARESSKDAQREANRIWEEQLRRSPSNVCGSPQNQELSKDAQTEANRIAEDRLRRSSSSLEAPGSTAK